MEKYDTDYHKNMLDKVLCLMLFLFLLKRSMGYGIVKSFLSLHSMTTFDQIVLQLKPVLTTFAVFVLIFFKQENLKISISMKRYEQTKQCKWKKQTISQNLFLQVHFWDKTRFFYPTAQTAAFQNDQSMINSLLNEKWDTKLFS
jgi:hypothetical protein